MEGIDGHTWTEAFEKYMPGVGYTIVNRLAGLRCMEVRDFIEEEVTVFKENNLTPAAETLVNEEFHMEEEANLAAYHNTCEELADEIEILYDRSSSYSHINPLGGRAPPSNISTAAVVTVPLPSCVILAVYVRTVNDTIVAIHHVIFSCNTMTIG
jgi:hypothetical protein